MSNVIGWLLMLLPALFALLKKVLPSFLTKIGKYIGGMTGTGVGSAATRGGVMGGIIYFLTKFWGWLTRFPAFVKTLFATGGALYFIRPILEFLLRFFKTPILLGISLVVSAFFPTIVEKIFLVVGSVALRLFLWIFKMGKSVFISSLEDAGSGGTGVLDEFRDSVLGSFQELPPCMVDVMGYLHLVEDLGLILTTAILIALVSLFRIVYGGFFIKSGNPLL